MATHSSILAWKIPWTEEPGGLQSTGLQRVKHDLVSEHAHKVVIYTVVYMSDMISKILTQTHELCSSATCLIDVFFVKKKLVMLVKDIVTVGN